MPPYDPDYDDSYLDEMEQDLKIEVNSIMQGRAVKQADEVYAGMEKQGIKRFNPRPIAPRIDLKAAVFIGGPEHGKLMAIEPGTYYWVIAQPLELIAAKVTESGDIRSHEFTMSFRRGYYKREGTALFDDVVCWAFHWQGWEGE